MNGTRPPRPPRPDGGEHAACATAASVAGLAREIEAVRVTAGGLTAVQVRIDEVADLVADLADDVAKLLAAAKERKPEPSWLGMPADTRPEDAAVLLVDLAEWLGRVYLRYPDGARGLPGCWLWHPEVIEELLWLRRAWAEAFRGPKSSTSAVADWHDRMRPGVTRRVQQYAGNCSVENHQLDRITGHDPRAATGGAAPEAAVGPIALWWAVNRDAEPPPPTRDQLAAATAPTRSGRSRRPSAADVPAPARGGMFR